MRSLNSNSIAVVGAGPAGCMSAYFLQDCGCNVTLFDFKKPLQTLLYTGGGRCNLAYAEYDFKELAKFYPRGEKFLYSVFSRFSTADTIDFFNSIGVETYVQDDLRIFPTSNSAKDVRGKFLKALKECRFKKEKVLKITKNECNFFVETNDDAYYFDKVVIAVGGHAGFSLVKNLGHSIVYPRPALTGLITKQNFNLIKGLSLKNVAAEVFYNDKLYVNESGDLLFTHEGISGPLAYKISSLCARIDYNSNSPLLIKLNLVDRDFDLQGMLNSNPKKDIKNLLSELVPKSLAEYILETNKIKLDTKGCDINGKTRDLILKNISAFIIDVISPSKDGEVVTSGGVCLNEINPKNMESKLVQGLYFCGEVIDVDGFCGGFNLQNCWSTGFILGNQKSFS